MIFRNSKKSDVDSIMHIIGEARESIGQLGIDQWQYGYPSRDIILDDIRLGQSYVGEENGDIIAVFALKSDGEPTYDRIYDGEWLTEDRVGGKCNYFALHRIAIAKAYRGTGVSSQLVNFIKNKCVERNKQSIRVDTHRGNVPMRKMLQKNGFEYCGLIYLHDGYERVAYEIKVKKKEYIQIYDISQELISSNIFPGDTPPVLTPVKRISAGDAYNLSDLNMCVHNGTHIDAPFHFIDGAPTVDGISLQNCIGDAYVLESDGIIDVNFIENTVPPDCCRLLIKGNVNFSLGVAAVLEERGVVLVGCEGQSISACEDCIAVHNEFLSHGIAILEGLDLSAVERDGKYTLCALPLKIAGADGAPCRAVLIKK